MCKVKVCPLDIMLVLRRGILYRHNALLQMIR